MTFNEDLNEKLYEKILFSRKNMPINNINIFFSSASAHLLFKMLI